MSDVIARLSRGLLRYEAEPEGWQPPDPRRRLIAARRRAARSRARRGGIDQAQTPSARTSRNVWHAKRWKGELTRQHVIRIGFANCPRSG